MTNEAEDKLVQLYHVDGEPLFHPVDPFVTEVYLEDSTVEKFDDDGDLIETEPSLALVIKSSSGAGSQFLTLGVKSYKATIWFTGLDLIALSNHLNNQLALARMGESEDKWMPIGTLPEKTSERVLLYDEGIMIGCWKENWADCANPVNPTDWMPLPKPPKKAGE
jgi:hypothetical protein